MKLSPVDHIFTGAGAYPVNFLFFFEQRLDEARLRDALEKCLGVFTPAGARLVPQSNKSLEFDGSKKYGWNSQNLDQAPDLENLSELGKFFKSAKSIPGENLLEVTLTNLKQGSCLGVSLSHCVVDGYSYFMFLSSWSKILRNLEYVKPHLDREKIIPTQSKNKDFSLNTVFEATGFSFSDSRRPGDDSEVKWEVIDYTDEAIKKLYANVSKEATSRLSINDVLCADLWQKLVKKYQRSGEEITLSCAYDYRRVYSATGPLYFGNAVRGAAFKASFDDAVKSPISNIALRIGSTVRSIDENKAKQSLQCLEDLRLAKGLESVEHFHVADPKRGFLFTNLSRLPLLELDFGAGAPYDFRILTPAKRTCVILPLKGGLRVQIAH